MINELDRIYSMLSVYEQELLEERDKAQAKIKAIESTGTQLDANKPKPDWDSIGTIQALQKVVDAAEDKLVDLGLIKGKLPSRIREDITELQTWFEWLDYLEDDKNRDTLGKEAELFRLAAEKARNRLSEWHVYGDGGIDQPFLNCNTVREDDE